MRHQLLAHALIAMLGHSVSDLVSKHHGQVVVRRCQVEDPLVNHDLPARHAEGVVLLVLDQVKLPAEVLQLALHAILAQIFLRSCGNASADAYDLFGFRLVARFDRRFHVSVVLRQAGRKQLRVGDKQHLPPTCQGDNAARRHNEQHA